MLSSLYQLGGIVLAPRSTKAVLLHTSYELQARSIRFELTYLSVLVEL